MTENVQRRDLSDPPANSDTRPKGFTLHRSAFMRGDRVVSGWILALVVGCHGVGSSTNETTAARHRAIHTRAAAVGELSFELLGAPLSTAPDVPPHAEVRGVPALVIETRETTSGAWTRVISISDCPTSTMLG